MATLADLQRALEHRDLPSAERTELEVVDPDGQLIGHVVDVEANALGHLRLVVEHTCCYCDI